jgi:hypothetical protein
LVLGESVNHTAYMCIIGWVNLIKEQAVIWALDEAGTHGWVIGNHDGVVAAALWLSLYFFSSHSSSSFVQMLTGRGNILLPSKIWASVAIKPCTYQPIIRLKPFMQLLT